MDKVPAHIQYLYMLYLGVGGKGHAGREYTYNLFYTVTAFQN